MTQDISKEVQECVLDAFEKDQHLKIIGGNSKHFYGNSINGDVLDVSAHQGVLKYEPTELFITARAGTPLNDIEKLLDDNNQMLGFEPPQFSPTATLGGTIACNFSGPRRPYAGSARDFLLGCKIINGKGESLSFGGEVIKNVAGYDATRLMCGALGSLGVILECSLKILPKPEFETSLSFEYTDETAIEKMRHWAQKSLPISATSYCNGQLIIRLSSTENAVKATIKKLGGDVLADQNHFSHAIKEQQHDFFKNDLPLWRISIDPNAPPLINHDSLYEWSGALRWILSTDNNDAIINYAKENGGHATLFRNPSASTNVFQPLPDGLKKIHHQLKLAFDPKKILNRHKLYPEF